MRPSLAVLAAALVVAAAPAAGQTAATSPAPATDLAAKPGTLSDKLSQTGGVIAPSGDVDPAMRRTAPQAGTMPVIPPGAVTPATPK